MQAMSHERTQKAARLVEVKSSGYRDDLRDVNRNVKWEKGFMVLCDVGSHEHLSVFGIILMLGYYRADHDRDISLPRDQPQGKTT